MGTLVNPNYREAPEFGAYGDVKIIDSGDITVATGDLDNGDLIKAFKAKKGMTVIGSFLQASDLDTNGTPTISLALGDLSDDDRFITGATIGRTGGFTDTLANTGMFYTFTQDTDIYIKVTAAAATVAGGTVRGGLMYYMSKV